MLKMIETLLKKLPIELSNISLIAQIIAIALVILAAVFTLIVAKFLLARFINKLISKTSSSVDDVLVRRNLFNRIALFAPVIVIYKLTPIALADFPDVSKLILTACLIYAVTILVLIVDSLINSVVEIYYRYSRYRHLPIKSLSQVCKLLTYLVATIFIVSLIIGESPLKLFAGLGAMAAVLMFVFKDPILGFVAGIQLSSNKMVRIGDWIEIPQHNADGDILEIGLTTVKVKNFDNTITTVPTQSLINDSFKNWRGMQESEGRRIKRSIFIDINSIGFCSEERLKRFAKIQYITEYLKNKQHEFQVHNQNHKLDLSSLANGRRLTNVGTFRAYIKAYLVAHTEINQELTVLVRQLAPNQNGLPIQIYAFSREKNWAKYEAIQADIFDHLLAVAKEFDLRVFQQPSGNDLKAFASQNS